MKLAGTAEIDALFTDRAPPAELAALLEQQQVEVVVAGVDPAVATDEVAVGEETAPGVGGRSDRTVGMHVVAI